MAACSGGSSTEKSKGGRGGRPSGPVEVGYVIVQQTSAPMYAELSARTAAYETSEVRPQVSGLIRRRLFTEGALVREGQTLYQIDPRLYEAEAGQARANLQNAQANLEAARIRAERYRPLAAQEAVSKQDYTDAVAQQRQAAAQVAQQRAALQTATVNRGFTRVPAPITGRIGRSLYTTGALVTANQTQPLAVIQRLDPMFVDIQQSSAELLTLRRSLSAGDVAPASAAVRLVLEDGSEYGFAGTVRFSEVTVDPSTGTVTMRATVPNPQGLLLPGMFVRARLVQAIDQSAFLVPQQAVTRTPQGEASVWIAGPDNIARERKVTATRAQDAYWVVTGGLKPGERIIIQGIANLRPNAQIRPVPARTPQRIEQRKQGEAGGAGSGQQKKAG